MKGVFRFLENTSFIPKKYRVYPIYLPHAPAVSSWLVSSFRRCEQRLILRDISESVRDDQMTPLSLREMMEPMPNMNALSPWQPGVLALGVFALMSLVLIIAFLFLASWLGEKKPNPEKVRSYECGIIPTGTARFPYPVAFYLTAAFFLIFDVEAAFIFSWAIAFHGLGWAGWLQISFFIAILIISLFYIWRKGGLEWGPTARENPVSPKTSSLPSSTD